MTIPQDVLDEIIAHAAQERPRECCGVLIGSGGEVRRSMRAGNIAEGTRRFRIDPVDHFRAIKLARQQQLDIVGFYHSHPQTLAYPSETDVAESAYAEVVHLIVGFPDGVAEARLFRLTPDAIAEEPLVVR